MKPSFQERLLNQVFDIRSILYHYADRPRYRSSVAVHQNRKAISSACQCHFNQVSVVNFRDGRHHSAMSVHSYMRERKT
jgi:hypothetical protein